MSKRPNSKRLGAALDGSKISDPRFASFETDPRFRLPSKRQTKTKVDKRFSRMLKDDEFVATSTVDRYGRKLKDDSKKKALQRLFEAEDADEDEDEDASDEAERRAAVQVDDDEAVKRELRAVDKKYDPARGGGFDMSDSESDSDDLDDGDEEDETQADAAGPSGASMQRLQDEQASVPTGEITNRIAIVNMDWDHIKSADLFTLLSSFAPSGGRILKVSIYPSEFGKERIQQEELDGPPRDIFKKAKEDDESSGVDDDEDDDSQEEEDEDEDEKIKKQLLEEGDDQDFDHDALRSYQLDRLRYFYAVMICSDKATAETIYREVDGREYLSSSNFLDLRFVPDHTTFDDEPRDECEAVPSGYKPVEFITDALQHSKVKLTWDMHPDEVARKDSMQRAFTGSRNDIAENDLRAYLASDSEDEDKEAPATVQGDKEGEKEEQPKLSKKELARQKMREALGLKDEGAPKASSKSGPVGDMQITFAPALSEKVAKVKDPAEETTIEKYARKERERKEQKREKARARREGRDPNDVGAAAAAPADPEAEGNHEAGDQPAGDMGFDDPFFTAEDPDKTVTKSAQRKEERRKRREARDAEEKEKTAERARLELLMAEDGQEEAGVSSSRMNHFDMNEILREEKRKGKKLKGKKAKKAAAATSREGGDGTLLQEDFEMDVDDERFRAVFEDHEFAIDPSHPKFKATSGMKKLLEKGRSKRKGDDHLEVERFQLGKGAKKVKVADGGGGRMGASAQRREPELAGLVEAVKRKNKKQRGSINLA